MNVDLTSWALLIHIAAITQVIGYFFKDQVILRSLLLIGTIFYILYYYFFQDTPLWDAIFWSGVMAIANFSVLIRLLSDKVSLFEDEAQARAFRMFHGFTPGMFRKLMKVATLVCAKKPTNLAIEGGQLNKLYFILEGGLRISKQKNIFEYLPSAFIGEVVFLSGGVASATVAVQKGTVYYEWEHETLKSLLKRNPELNAHLNALLNQDMARKIRSSLTLPPIVKAEGNHRVNQFN